MNILKYEVFAAALIVSVTFGFFIHHNITKIDDDTISNWEIVAPPPATRVTQEKAPLEVRDFEWLLENQKGPISINDETMVITIRPVKEKGVVIIGMADSRSDKVLAIFITKDGTGEIRATTSPKQGLPRLDWFTKVILSCGRQVGKNTRFNAEVLSLGEEMLKAGTSLASTNQ